MEQPDVTLKDLVEVGAHFGHKVWKCHPKMAPYVFENRRGISIIDLRKTQIMLQKAMVALYNSASLGGQILFVCTRKQTAELIKETADRTAQFYVNHRWLGGTLTNWDTVGLSCNRLAELERDFEKKGEGLTKREVLRLARERDKMRRIFDGIKGLRGLPGMLVVLDVKRDRVAVAEARRLKIPVVALIDSDSDVEQVDFPIPANDDSEKAVKFFLKIFGDAVLAGLKKHLEGEHPELPAAKAALADARTASEVTPADSAPEVAADAKADAVAAKSEVVSETEKDKDKDVAPVAVEPTSEPAVEPAHPLPAVKTGGTLTLEKGALPAMPPDRTSVVAAAQTDAGTPAPTETEGTDDSAKEKPVAAQTDAGTPSPTETEGTDDSAKEKPVAAQTDAGTPSPTETESTDGSAKEKPVVAQTDAGTPPPTETEGTDDSAKEKPAAAETAGSEVEIDKPVD